MLLNSSNLLRVINTGTSPNIDWTVRYEEYTVASGLTSMNMANGNISSATTTTLIAAPAAGTYRKITYLSLYNNSASNATAQVQTYNGATGYNTVQSDALAQNYSLIWTPESGWSYHDSSGNSILTGVTTFSAGTTGLTPSAATSGSVALAGVLVEANGGTHQSTYATGDILYSSASNTLSTLAIGSSSQVLAVAAGIPSWVTPSAGSLLRSARTSNTILAGADNGYLIDITSGTFSQTFTAAATLTNGWWCYIRNSGSGEITLDPNGSETIDGLTTYVMYPGEVRLVQCDGSNFNTVIIRPFYYAYTTSGTLVVPPGYSSFTSMVWGGGASGLKSAAAVGGGGGGGCFRSEFVPPAAGTSLTVTVGAGGVASTAASYNNGTDSSITNGGTTYIIAYGAVATSGGYSINGVLNATTNKVTGYETPVTTATTNALASGIWGGGCSASNTIIGSSIWGGAAGGGSSGSAGGTSIYGGNGGAGKGAGAGSGVSGSAPGGGGGNTNNGTQSGAGARGEVRIWGTV